MRPPGVRRWTGKIAGRLACGCREVLASCGSAAGHTATGKAAQRIGPGEAAAEVGGAVAWGVARGEGPWRACGCFCARCAQGAVGRACCGGGARSALVVVVVRSVLSLPAEHFQSPGGGVCVRRWAASSSHAQRGAALPLCARSDVPYTKKIAAKKCWRECHPLSRSARFWTVGRKADLT